MNSWRVSLHIWPVAVSHWIAGEPLVALEVDLAGERVQMADRGLHRPP